VVFFRVTGRDKLSEVVGVAQLVERRSVAPNVAGSIPVSHPNPSQLKTKSFAIRLRSFERQDIAQSLLCNQVNAFTKLM
jgi:hypothetical protein